LANLAPVEQYSHARIATKRKALENMGKGGHDTVTTQICCSGKMTARKWLKTMVDETGVEPATSSLRTMRI